MVSELGEGIKVAPPSVSVLHTSLGLASADLIHDVFNTCINPNTKALIVVGWSNGTVHNKLLPLIQQVTQKGISVFVLSDNPKDDHGVQSLKYQTQLDAVHSGAILLKTVNTAHADDVFNTINDQIQNGKSGEELNKAITDKFGIPSKPDSKT